MAATSNPTSTATSTAVPKAVSTTVSDTARKAVQVGTPTDTEIVLTRVFDAPRQLVFDAWTRPELLMRWYGARGWELVECEIDLRAGGNWRFVSRGPGGAMMASGGVYMEVVPPERLACTESYDDQWYPGEALVSTVFTEEAGRTTVTSTLRYPTRQVRDLVLSSPMERGIGESFDRLAELLAAKEAS